MLDKLEKLFPEALPALRRQPIVTRVAILAALLALALGVTMGWAPGMKLLREGAIIEVPVRLLVAGLFAISTIALLAFLAAARLRWRSRLRDFVRQWVELRKCFELLHMRIDDWLARDAGFDDPKFGELTEEIQDYFARCSPLRRLLFLLGEESLVAKESQHWIELKSTEPIFKQQDYLTPFGFLLDLRAPIASVNNHGHAIWAALSLSDEYLEFLIYKYPFLEKAAA
ncbi:MAG: hypothetical protein WD397_03810 [Wenzhouxiangellaceae bacterium]